VAYAPAEHESVRTSQSTWPLPERTVKVLLTVPAHPRSLPLVIYVPGLGESNGAGDRWRAAWSAAGYAVMSVQPLLEDETAWTSELARTGEFKSLAREHYGAAATSRRVRALEAIAAEARRRSRAGEEGWERIDWDRVAIAGFDLGAYTALASLGITSTMPKRQPRRSGFAPRSCSVPLPVSPCGRATRTVSGCCLCSRSRATPTATRSASSPPASAAIGRSIACRGRTTIFSSWRA
jgi:hypothetical protein